MKYKVRQKEVIKLFNPYHDKLGRFASKPGGNVALLPNSKDNWLGTQVELSSVYKKISEVAAYTRERFGGLEDVKFAPTLTWENANNLFYDQITNGRGLLDKPPWMLPNDTLGVYVGNTNTGRTHPPILTPFGLNTIHHKQDPVADLLISHELLHARERSNGRNFNIREFWQNNTRSFYHEEGTTELLSLKTVIDKLGLTKNRKAIEQIVDETSPYVMEMVGVVMNLTKNFRPNQYWETISLSHYYNDSLEGLNLLGRGGKGGKQTVIDVLMEDAPTQLEESNIDNYNFSGIKEIREKDKQAKRRLLFDTEIILEDSYKLFNPYHDELGRFTRAPKNTSLITIGPGFKNSDISDSDYNEIVSYANNLRDGMSQIFRGELTSDIRIRKNWQDVVTDIQEITRQKTLSPSDIGVAGFADVYYGSGKVGPAVITPWGINYLREGGFQRDQLLIHEILHTRRREDGRSLGFKRKITEGTISPYLTTYFGIEEGLTDLLAHAFAGMKNNISGSNMMSLIELNFYRGKMGVIANNVLKRVGLDNFWDEIDNMHFWSNDRSAKEFYSLGKYNTDFFKEMKGKESEIDNALSTIFGITQQLEEFNISKYKKYYIFYNESEKKRAELLFKEEPKEIQLFNPYHDSLGRFTTGPSASSALFGIGGSSVGVSGRGVLKDAAKILNAVDSTLYGGTTDPKITTSMNWNEVKSKTGINSNQFLGAYVSGLNEIVISPAGLSAIRTNPRLLNRIMTHESVHSRRRSTNRPLTFINSKHAMFEEGLTDLISLAPVNNKINYNYSASPYYKQMQAVARAARQNSNGDISKAWQWITQSHYYNDDFLAINGRMNGLGDSIFRGTGTSSDIDWLFRDVPTRLEITDEEFTNMMKDSEIAKYEALGIKLEL